MARTVSVQRSARMRLIHAGDAPPEIIERLARQPDTLVAEGVPLKNKPGDRCTVVRLESSRGPVVLKRFNLKSPLHTMMHTPLRTRASWGWRNGHRLIEAGICTPRPLACLERRRGPLRFQSWLLTEFVEGPTLKTFVEQHAHDQIALEEVARAFAGLWCDLGTLRAVHRDMKATNFIVIDGTTICMLDLDGLRLGVPPPLHGRMRRRNLDRFMRNWREGPAALAAFRAQFDTA